MYTLRLCRIKRNVKVGSKEILTEVYWNNKENLNKAKNLATFSLALNAK